MIRCSAEVTLFRILFNTFVIVCYSLALCKLPDVYKEDLGELLEKLIRISTSII